MPDQHETRAAWALASYYEVAGRETLRAGDSVLIWLMACTSGENADSGRSEDTEIVSDLAPLEPEAVNYAEVCADRWPDETCATEPCDMDATTATWEGAWRAWVQPRWDLTDAEYEARVDLWRARSDGDRLDLAHVISVGWHRAMVSYSSSAAGAEPDPAAAAAYWESYDPAFDIPFRQPLVSYADVIAAAQPCADEIARPLLPDGICTTHVRRIADVDTRFAVVFTTASNGADYNSVEVDLVTGEAGACEHLTSGEELTNHMRMYVRHRTRDSRSVAGT